ncbi:MAG: hypothetical protein OEW29_09235 [Acidimicrobiia bacterium]|nr:hypothetical protein [Acidimicrobiia bacterium]
MSGGTHHEGAGRRQRRAKSGSKPAAGKGGQRDQEPADAAGDPPDEAAPHADELTEAEEAFIEALVARGEAAEADEEGHLPEGATHEIVPDERKVVRRRFSAY